MRQAEQWMTEQRMPERRGGLRHRGVALVMTVVLTGLTAAVPALAQPPAGPTAAGAKELSTLLAKAAKPGPRFIAAEDPTDPTRFVAAMLLPDLQLLVVSATYRVPVLLRERVLTRKYREAYLDLQAGSGSTT